VRIRVLKSFGGYKAGQEFYWGDGIARIFVARGLIKEIDEEADERVESATVEQRTEKAMIDTKPRRRQK
jgi:hypothetical protein